MKMRTNIKISVLLIFVTVLLKIENTLESCGFDHHKKKTFHKFEEEEDKENLRFLDSQTFQPIRIYFDYTTLDSQTSLTDEMKTNIKMILTYAKAALQNLISVKRLTSKAKINQCDSSVMISDLVKNTGVDSDLVIFPYYDSSISGATEAYASGCVISGRNNRPVAGLMAFTKNFNSQKGNWLQYYTNLSMHELTHVLAFNPDLFSLFIDSNGQALPIEKVMKTETVNGLQRNIIITPKVVAAAQKHFGCNSITGLELENQGGTSTVSSHWEARLMLGDYMIGVSYDEMTMSEITLAFLEDSGWYKVNYFTGGLFRFGKNQGCGFLSNKCVASDGSVTYTNEYCNVRYSPMCSTGKSTRGICYITEYPTNIDSNYKYFSSLKEGGLMLADYCPITEVPTNSTSFFPWSCSIGYNQYPSQLEEVISPNSACFMSSLVNTNYVNILSDNYLQPRSICYKYDCDFDVKRINVTVGSKTVRCPVGGGFTSIEGYSGTILCPDFNLICTSTSRCSNMIDCALNSILPIDFTYDYERANITFNTSTVISPANYTVNTTNYNNTEKYNKPLYSAGNFLRCEYFSLFYLIAVFLIFYQ